MSAAFRWTCVVMALVLLCFAAVQYNDPDPVRWMAIYGAACLASALAAFRLRSAWLPAAVVGAVALAWAAYWCQGVIGRHVDMGEVFAVTRMIDTSVEETRETLGLLIVAVWMAVVAVRGRRVARSA
jgi:transmembrane protein TMEM220